MANYFEELIERAEKRAKKRISEKVARNLLELGENTLEGIAKATGLTLKRVQKLAETFHKA